MFKQVHQFVPCRTKRIYYDGDHSDFVDTTDRSAGEEGVFNAQLDTSGLDSGVDPYAIGNWARSRG